MISFSPAQSCQNLESRTDIKTENRMRTYVRFSMLQDLEGGRIIIAMIFSSVGQNSVADQTISI